MILGRSRRGYATILRASPTEDPTVAMSSVLEGSGGHEGLTLVQQLRSVLDYYLEVG